MSFPARLLGSQTTALGSHPASDQIGWSGGNLLVATVINGAGNSLTGIWTVAASGGPAHLALGNPTALDLRHANPALQNATHFLVSRHGSTLATDPGRRFAVSSASGAGSRFLAPRMAVSCTISQWSWLVGGQGLAYVTLCTVGGTTGFRSTLYTVQLPNGRPQPVVTVVSPKMTALKLVPATRCIACG